MTFDANHEINVNVHEVEDIPRSNSKLSDETPMFQGSPSDFHEFLLGRLTHSYFSKRKNRG